MEGVEGVELAACQAHRMEVAVCEMGSNFKEEFIGKLEERHGSGGGIGACWVVDGGMYTPGFALI